MGCGMYDIEVVVIGAGVVGLAVARAYAMAGHEVVVLEAQESFGTEVSSRNSEVIHAGIYYAPDSLKAKMCIEGKGLLYEYCQQKHIPHQQIGKLLVATSSEQAPKLKHIQDNAAASGMTALEWLEGAAAQQLEPELKIHAALYSPTTGIIDSHQYMLSLVGDIEAQGGSILYGSPLVTEDIQAAEADKKGVSLQVGGHSACRLTAKYVINCAGLTAVPVAHALLKMQGITPRSSSTEVNAAERIPHAYYCKGNYLAYHGKHAFSHLVYPLPNEAGLGVHSTLSLDGRLKFGPDHRWVAAPDYEVDDCAEAFAKLIKAWWPGVEAANLQADYVGVRPKIVGPGAPAADFIIQTPKEHGMAGITHLFGIESPGLTASLALAAETKKRSLNQP